jgi:starch synthase
MDSTGDRFIVGVVSRLTAQKGVHLIKHAAWRTMDRGGQFVLLGSAPDPRVQNDFNEFARVTGGAQRGVGLAWTGQGTTSILVRPDSAAEFRHGTHVGIF